MPPGAREGVDLVVQFLNTVDLEDASDVLDDAGAWTVWCADRGLVPGRLDRVRAVRDGLRDVVDGGPVRLPPVHLVLSPGTDGVELTAGSADAVERILVEVAVLVATGAFARVKLCPADDCRWAFVDRSRNRSRTWCDMDACGNRAKVRTFRARHQDGAGAHA